MLLSAEQCASLEGLVVEQFHAAPGVTSLERLQQLTSERVPWAPAAGAAAGQQGPAEAAQALHYPELKQLAVTADQWLPISAVSPGVLPAFLAAMRADGYTLVALEQTHASQPLPRFRWPKRCLLLLGAEGSGVPPDLLPLLDAAVEIPQLGVIRSLNVHVSAALAIYSYSLQHGLNTD